MRCGAITWTWLGIEAPEVKSLNCNWFVYIGGLGALSAKCFFLFLSSKVRLFSVSEKSLHDHEHV